MVLKKEPKKPMGSKVDSIVCDRCGFINSSSNTICSKCKTSLFLSKTSEHWNSYWNKYWYEYFIKNETDEEKIIYKALQLKNMIRHRRPLLRQKVLERDKHRCVKCGSKKNIHVHHKNYYSMSMKDMYVVCHECHKKVTKGATAETGLSKKQISVPMSSITNNQTSKMKMLLHQLMIAKVNSSCMKLCPESQKFLNTYGYLLKHIM